MYTVSTQLRKQLELLLVYRTNDDTLRNDSYVLRQRGIWAAKREGKRRMYGTYGRSKGGSFLHEIGLKKACITPDDNIYWLWGGD